MKSSLKKMFIMLVISAILLVACGRKDPLNRQTAYFGITEGSSTEVYGVKELYRANTEITREQFLEQDGDSLPKEKVGTLLYEETPQEDGYELIVYYQSLVTQEYSREYGGDVNKCFCFNLSANENKNVEIFKLLSMAAK